MKIVKMTKRIATIAIIIALGLFGFAACPAPGGGGTTTAPEIQVGQSTTDLPSGTGQYDFGSSLADGNDASASSFATFTIQNLGTADLTITGLSISGSDFDKTDPLALTISPSGSTTFTVRFDPLTAGSKSSTVTINNNDADEGVYTVQVIGLGTAVPEPEINVQLASITLPNGTGTHDFGSVVADGDGGAASSDVTFTIQNLGSADLTISGLTVSGSDFDKTAPVSTVIAGPGSTTFTLRFDPLTVGSTSSTVTINNNDSDEGVYTFQVTGEGTTVPVPEINVQQGSTDLLSGAGSHNFGSVVADGDGGTASSDVTFTIQNLGSADLTISSLTVSGSDFDKTAPVSTAIAGSGSTTFTVRFDPLTTGSKSATVTINSNDADEAVYTFQVTGVGTAVPAPEINVQQGSTDLLSGAGTYPFGSVIADGDGGTASGFVTFTIQNLGTADLTISSLTISGSDFDKTAPVSTVVAGSGSTTFTVRFDPLTGGSTSATVTINNNDADEGIYTFQVTGSGTTAPEINVQQGATNLLSGTGTCPFGSVIADGDGGTASSSLTFTIQNLGTANLTISSLTISGSDFDKTDPLVLTVSPSSSTTFTVRFDPLTTGSKSSTVTINNNDADEGVYTFQVIGLGTTPPAPEINVQQGGANLLSGAGTYDFGSVYVDGDGGTASGSITFTIQNLGTANLAISSLTISGADFDKTDPLAFTITPSSSTTFTVRFDPLTAGSRSSTVTINSNDADEGAYTFQVMGLGTSVVTAPEINVQQGSTDLLNGTGTYDFGSVLADGDGNTASDYVTFTIQNLGTADLVISGLMISGYDFVDFDRTDPLATTISPSGSTTFTARFDPRTILGKYSTIKITSNDADEGTYIFAMTGSGSGTPDIDIWQGATNILKNGLYNFGSVKADGAGGVTSGWLTFTVKNVGNATLTLGSIGIMNQNGSGFGYTSFPGIFVLPGSSTTFTVQFDPETVGSKTGFMTIGSNDPDESNYDIDLTGTGTP